jgi:hypothetical protein
MKEARTKIMILILTLYVVFDPSIQKIKHSKEYLHSLFSEPFDDTPDYTKKVVPIISIRSSQNEVGYLLRK